jgi:spore coat protein H
MTRWLCGAWLGWVLFGISLGGAGCDDDATRPRLDAAADGAGTGGAAGAGGAVGQGGAGDAAASADLAPVMADAGGGVGDTGAPPPDSAPGAVDAITPAADVAPAPDAAPDGPVTISDAGATDLAGPVDVVSPVVDVAPPLDVPPTIDAAPATDGGRTYPSPSAMSVAVFDESTIVDYFLTFPPDAWNNLLTLSGPNDTRWVPCTFSTLGGPVVSAACRRKGDVTDWPFEAKPQIIVRFNLVNKQGRYRGLRRFNLESFDGLAAPIRDRIGMWVMREAGLDAPRVNHVRVFKDGALLGVYMNIESLDKEFLEDHYGPAGSVGNLWDKGEELKTNETINDRTRLTALNDLVDAEPLTGDHSAFFAQLAARMDVPEVLREMAVETILITDDNFSQGSTNFDYYEHPTRGFLVLPWDLDSIITVAAPDTELYAFKGVSDGSKLRALMNQNPTWKALFDDDLVDVRDNVYTRAPAKVDAVCAQIRAAVAADPNRSTTIDQFDADCANVKNGVVARIAAIKAILGR